VRDAFDADVPDGSTYETMGGFVMTSLGRVPVVGDVVRLAGWRINVVGMEGRRVDRLRFVPDPDSLPQGDDDAGSADPADRTGRMPSAGAPGDRS
jgi:CBS domain containing-hemolysin-like protein